VARIQLAAEVGDVIERILEHLAQYEVEDAPGRIQEILEAVSVLAHNPLIGRPVKDEAREACLRELVIGRRTRGYVALYRYVPELDVVFVLALRGQREAGYAREGGDEP
jgi:plasmid stabilization system protein ParE